MKKIGGADIARSRVLAFGESTHGTREFWELFYAVVLELSASTDVVTVALERDPISGFHMNEWIEGCGSVAAHLGNVGLPYQYASERAFLERAREWNHRGEGCIRIVGVDVPYGQVEAYMRVMGEGCLGARGAEVLAHTTEILSGARATFGTAEGPGLKVLDELREATRDVSGPWCEEFLWWFSLMEVQIGIPSVGATLWEDPIDRDLLMANNVEYWADRSDRVFFDAHAMHVIHAPLPHVHGGGVSTPAGLHLEERLGEDYAAVLMTFGHGMLLGNPCIRGRSSVRRIPPARHPSFQRDMVAATSAVAGPTEEICVGRECSIFRAYVGCLPRSFPDSVHSYYSFDAVRGFDWLVFFPYANAAEPRRSTYRATYLSGTDD